MPGGRFALLRQHGIQAERRQRHRSALQTDFNPESAASRSRRTLVEIHMRSTLNTIQFRISGEVELRSIPLKWKPIPELLAHLGLLDHNWTWRWDTSQGMDIAITVEDDMSKCQNKR